MSEAGAREDLRVVITSKELGLPRGSLADLDVEVQQFNREQLVRRLVAIQAGLVADTPNGCRNVSISLAAVLGPAHELSHALRDPQSLFVEPLQQLVILRRALTVPEMSGSLDVWTDEGIQAYVAACRYAGDLLAASVDDSKRDPFEPDRAVQIAANFLLRSSLVEPPEVTNWIARMRLMLTELPKAQPRTEIWAHALRERIEFAFGLTFDDVARLVGMIALWSVRFTTLGDVFSPHTGVAMSPESWLSQTTLDREHLVKFFDRTAIDCSASLSDASLGGGISILPFRDRPFIRFEDGSNAPSHSSLVIEKLTYDLFWWSGSPDQRQPRPWQRDWGDLVEAYVVDVLAWIAQRTGCEFMADVRWDTKQIDAAMWFKGHVALFEISAAMLTDDAAHSGDAEHLADGLRKILVRSQNAAGKSKDEAIAQVARDARALLSGHLSDHLPVTSITRVYPVVIAIDRRVRTPPLRFWFDAAFESEMSGFSDRDRVAPLAVWGLEDLETIEQLARNLDQCLKGTPRGILRLLRDWELLRDRLPKTGKRAAAWKHFVGHQIPAPPINDRLKSEADRWWSEVKDIFKKNHRNGPRAAEGSLPNGSSA